MNQSQENWPDTQLSLSTATPSLGGAPPKLTTLKIDYYQPRYIHHQSYDYDRLSEDMHLQAVELCGAAAPMKSKKSKGFVRLRARSVFHSKPNIEEEGWDTENTVNVLSTTTEASMSSTSFAIPRRSTINADVSFLFF